MTRIFLASAFYFFCVCTMAQTIGGVTPSPPPKPTAKKMSVRAQQTSAEPDAADYSTDALFISKAGELGVLGQLAYLYGSLDFTSTSSSTFDGFLSNFTAQYGFESYLNIYLSQGYTNYTITTNSNPDYVATYKGVGDTTLGAKGSTFLTPGFLISYDAYYRAPLLDKAETDDSKPNESSSKGVTERSRVGLSTTLAVLMDRFSIGAFADGQFYQEGNYTSILSSSSRTVTQSSGTSSSFNIFAQYDFGAKIGASLLVSNQDPYDVTINNTKTHNGGSKSTGVRVYGILPLGVFEIGLGLTKPNYVNTATPVTTNIYYTDALVRARF